MPETLPILYSFRRCPYAIRARMALCYAGINCVLREVDLKHKPAHMLEISPKGTVPVLLFPDGTILEESLDIMRWALSQKDDAHWALNAKDEAVAMALIAENDGPFATHLRFYKYAARYPDENIEEHKDLASLFLQKLDEHLPADAYLFSEHPGMADIAIYPFVRQFRIAGTEWFDNAPYPRLQNWLAKLSESDLYNKVMVKHPPWQEGNAPVLFAS